MRTRRFCLGRGLALEGLEDRRLLTIVFNTQYGAETLVNSAPFTVLNSPTVHLLLWGPKWGTGAGQTDPTPVINEAKAILNSTYLKGLTEYGSDGLIGSVDSYVDTANAVPADFNPGFLKGTNLTEAQTELTTVVNANHLPGPGTPASVSVAPMYVIITDPTHSGGTNGGYNTSTLVNTQPVNVASVGTDANLQLFGDTFSHEMAERISDPTTAGVVLSEPSTIPTSLLNDPTKAYNNSANYIQNGDGEAEPSGQDHYSYQLGTSEVQPFWSNSFSAFIAPDGNTQRFNLAPIWNTSTVTFSDTFNLTINGDQLANKNDTIIVFRDAAGGVEVSLNGEIAKFDPKTSTFEGTPLNSITINGGTGNDSLTIDYSNGNPIPVGGLIYNGGAGTNQIFANANANYTLSNTLLTTSLGGGITLSSVQVANLNGGIGDNTFNVSGWTGSGQINGQSGNDTLTAIKSNQNFTLNGSTLTTTDGMNLTIVNVEQVNLTAAASSASFNFFGNITTNLNATGGGSNDTFNWNAANNVYVDNFRNITRYAVTLNGGGGTNSLIVSDASRGEFNYNMYSAELVGYDINGAGTNDEDLNYSGIESMSVTASADDNSVIVYGTSSQITGQTTLLLGDGNDSVTVYVRDAAGNPTILSNLGISGGNGGDNLYLIDPCTTSGTTWTISNPFGASTQDFAVTGGALIGTGSDVEGNSIYGSTGDDTFNVNQYMTGSALGIAAGDGNDTLNIGNGNLAANITSISAFNFDGQAGFDTFNVNNASETNGWTYTNTANSIQALRGSPGYTVTLGQFNVEHLAINAGPNADNLSLTAVAAGELLAFFGNDGNDTLSISSPIAVQGPVYFYGGSGTGNQLNILSNTDTADRTVHLDQTSLGTFPGDNYFGSGGALYFYSLQSMVITMGSGSDTVYAEPNATATVNINGGLPTTIPGDTLNLALAGVVNYVVTPTSPTAGNVTSDNLKTLTWSGFETGPNIDDVAPSIITQSYDESGFVSSIFVQFSEDVSAALNVGYLGLINTTTAQQVPSAVMALTYDAGTNTARFTFPGYANGILPNGGYTATIAGSLTDLFGNPMGVETPFSFSVLHLPPSILAQGYVPSGPAPSIFVQFSEDVSATLILDDLVLINNTTAQQVPSAVMALAYDTGTNTATFTFPGYPGGVLPAGDYTAKILGSLTDSFGNALGVETPFGFSVFSSSVVGRNLFYHNSTRYDVGSGDPGHNGQTPLPFSDDNAIAIDKSAYLPNGSIGLGTTTAATFASVSSYDRGINGIMVDLAGTHGTITASDFTFKLGNNNTPSTWTTPAGVDTPTVLIRPGEGAGGSDRIELIWPDGTIKKTWLEAIVKGNDTVGGNNTNTGLAASDTFFFASAVGDSGNGDTLAFTTDTLNDELGPRGNPKTLLNNIPITNIYDYNRDGKVDSIGDELLARGNPTSALTAPKFIKIGVPPAAPGLTAAAGLGSGLTAAATVGSSGGSAAPGWLSHSLGAAIGTGKLDNLFRHLAETDTEGTRNILVKFDAALDALGIEDDVLDSLLVGLGLE